MMPQIKLKASLQHGSEVHPASLAKGRTGDTLQCVPGAHLGNIVLRSTSKACAGDKIGKTDMPNSAQAQTAFTARHMEQVPWWRLTQCFSQGY